MSHQLINRNADLKRLRDEGYDIEVTPDNFLLVKNVPYVTEDRTIAYGTLISNLSLAGDVTVKPEPHTVSFGGTVPCDANGKPLTKIIHSNPNETLAEGLVGNFIFSSKPPDGYVDYHEKMSTYAHILVAEARAIDESVSATPFLPIQTDADDDEPFQYFDTASSRAEITAINYKLRLTRIAIVGVGGTGSYILDLVAKTPVREIHIFDGDRFLNHNAFRAPGAPSLAQLQQQPFKVDYLRDIYQRMHKGIMAHPYAVTRDNVHELEGMDFAFLAMAAGASKQAIVENLHERGIPFIDVGMGVYRAEDRLGGQLRVTTIAPHAGSIDRIPLVGPDKEDEYAQNIQVADLNALNAALAVIKWKKLFGFYLDLECEHASVYVINGNIIINEDHAQCPD